MPHLTDLNLVQKDIQGLTSADALAALLTSMGYDTSRRQPLSPEAIGLSGDSAVPIRAIEVLAEDAEGFLRVVFVQLRSLTAKSRNDLARVLGRTNVDHLLVLTSDFDTLEFVLLDKRRRETRGPVDVQRIQVVPLSLAVARKAIDTRQLRTVRRFTWTGRDGLEQFDKLRSVFEAAAFSEDYFCNRALFADHYLVARLREDAAWRDNPTEAFQRVKQLLGDARQRWLGKGEQIVREQLYEPLFKLLGFQAAVNKAAGEAHTKPDYLLAGPTGKTAAFVYAWDRWLDGPDFNLDQQTPEENPGACVVTALDEGVADWIIVTNGRQWRLYSRRAHSRATNFYEVDLAEALVASGDTDPNEAFRYWWLFFRAAAFGPLVVPASAGLRRPPEGGTTSKCWLDAVAEGSRDYAKQLGERLKARIFETIFPHLAQGFLEDRKRRLGLKRQPTEEELHDIYEATLTLLYRLLFLLFAESRDLLPIREAPYRAASVTRIKEEIAERAGIAETEVAARLTKAYSASDTTLYDRLARLCGAMDRGDPTLNVPVYNGGLFITRPDESDTREQRIARFLAEHKVPDRFLAPALDRLARDPDDKTLGLVFIDYKSLEVRHLGSIYEGLLEFQLRVADEDLATKTEKGKEKFIPLAAGKPKRGKSVEAVVRKGEVYLSNDKAERKASGSYYTPDPIVEYIVEHTVGPVLAEKLEKLRGELRAVRKTFDNEIQKARAYPPAHLGRGASGEETATRDVALRAFAAEKTYLNHRDLVERLFDFRTLDPAMGSGHFLVEAVDFITDRLLTFLNQFPVNPVSFMLDRTRRNILEALGEQNVSVDPDKLTEVNLLKRHVLKRCIYGVDLNPMAVELAKVSLWLDAFTIGAPLSFLDHHLRCGNSLIGATFAQLDAQLKASKNTAGMLFGIDYQPLLRAVQHVLLVNQMADATAAEVKRSASEYDQARHDLSGYQIVLDLVTAEHLGFPDAPKLLQHFGNEIDLASRDRLMKSLEDLEGLALVEKVSEIASQPDRRFFHWEIEFPEVFFAFADAEQRQIRHKSQIAAGSAGFDAVTGNPPYSGHKGDFDATPLTTFYEVCRTYANPATAFLERGFRVLRSNSRLGMIVPKSIQYVESWAASRRLLAESNHLIGIADVSQAFDDVLLEQTVCLAATEPPVDGYFAATLAEDGTISGRRIERSVAQSLGCFPARVDARSLKLLKRVLEAGPRLGEIGTTSQALGYQAHLNNDVTGKHFPIYRGKQIRPMRIDPSSDFIDRSFLTRAGEDDLTPKVLEMMRPKVVSQNIIAHLTQPKPRVWIISAPDHDGILCLNTISTTVLHDNRYSIDYVATILNSTLASWFYTELVFCRAIRTMHFDNYYAGKLPVAKMTSSRLDTFAELVQQIEACTSRGMRQRAIDDAVFDIYGLSGDERRFLYEFCYGTDQLEAILSGF